MQRTARDCLHSYTLKITPCAPATVAGAAGGEVVMAKTEVLTRLRKDHVRARQRIKATRKVVCASSSGEDERIHSRACDEAISTAGYAAERKALNC